MHDATAGIPWQELTLLEEFASDVLQGLSANKKYLAPKYFYDSRGSKLFEEICLTPEYYVTRTEHNILCRNADSIIAMIPKDAALVEFGSGNSVKTRLLIEALLRRNRSLRYHPIDISSAALASSAKDLLQKYPSLDIKTIHAEYFDGMESLSTISTGPKLILFLGSNIGNFEPNDAINFLTEIRNRMNPEDRLLVGVDMVKDITILEAAYNDLSGVTAEFNLNLLRRINRELNADFDLSAFRHLAFFNPAKSRVEMHLESLQDQTVTIRAIDKQFSFVKGETIHTENSYKYSDNALRMLFRDSGLNLTEQWTDEKRYFTVNLLSPQA
jgi:L-histidine Nalpha-methyltransferase